MPASENSPKSSALPRWLRTKLPSDPAFAATRGLLTDLRLHTVCQSARCPNMFECFSKKVATFLVLGSVCTRNCAFCNIEPGHVLPPDPDEPVRVAEAARRLNLRHVVVTSVTRDDLPDGGAGHFAATIRAVRQALPDSSVEVLIPDLQGDAAALAVVIEAAPDILNHNVETVPSLYPRIRPQAVYARSLELLRRAKDMAPGMLTKGGLMLGHGEDMEDVRQVIRDLVGVRCDIVTVGQYMRPSLRHPEVARYVPPDEFDALTAYGQRQGVPHMFCGPLVRSSYNAGKFVEGSRGCGCD